MFEFHQDIEFMLDKGLLKLEAIKQNNYYIYYKFGTGEVGDLIILSVVGFP